MSQKIIKHWKKINLTLAQKSKNDTAIKTKSGRKYLKVKQAGVK